MKKVIAIYHKDCNDGTTAGAVVLRKFPEAKVFPLSHSHTREELENILSLIDEGTDVYTVDNVLGVKEILSLGFKVTSIDHHIGAKEEYEKLAIENKNFTFIFDNDKSGASLSWSYFFPDDEVPELIKLVEDADLFKLKYRDDTKDMGNYLSIFQNDSKAVAGLINSDLDEKKDKGRMISIYEDKRLTKELEKLPITIKIGDFEVPVYNIDSGLRSVGGNILSSQQNKTVGIFGISGNTVKISFRGRDGHEPNALTLAQILGGNGHKKAAAAFISLSKFLEMIVK
ncbi:MAG: phosphoesterase [Minisyncoccia bacterium]